MKKLLFIFTLLSSLQSFSQKRICATMEVNAKNQAFILRQSAGQRTAQKTETKNSNVLKRVTQVYNIPVIVHVIHNGEAEGTGTNISAAQILSQIAVLNEDFRNLNADKSGIPAAFQSAQADVELNFCLAAIDKDGNEMAQPGIDRVDRNNRTWKAPPYDHEYIDDNIKTATIWNPSNYLNIWVTDVADDVLGYSQFPDNNAGLGGIDPFGGAANTDGVVIHYRAFGRVGNVTAPYNRGRTTTHEMGHFFGLRHIWGDESCGNDFVNDTPTQQGENSGCPVFPQVTCNNSPNGDMFMNFMDYTNDACMFMFTADQKARIQAVMAANTPRRSSLGNSTVCNSSAVPVANFTFSPVNVVAGTTVVFTDNSSGNPSSWLWNFGGGANPNTSTTRNPSVTFTTAGTYQVSLTATNANGSNTVTKTIIVTAFNCTDTLTNFIGNPVLYQVSGDGEYGYLSGHNSYEDKAKADKFSYSGPPIKLSKLIFDFAIAEGTGSITFTVWDANAAGGKPGTVLFSRVVPISQINTQGLTVLDIANPINITGDFFVGFPLVYGTTDTVALYTNESALINSAWEQWSNGAWHEYPDGWGIEVNHRIAVVFDNRATPVGSSATVICNNADVTNSATFTDANCGVIAKVEPSGASDVSGLVSTCVRIQPTVPVVNGKPYVQRYFDINPSTNASTVTATITLYFRDQDFVNYNANRGSNPPLPTLAGGGNADPAKSNLFVTQQHGTSPTGLPGTYSGTTVVINPDDSRIVWNASLSAWEVTFDIVGFSGFFVHSGSTALPIVMEYFNGEKAGSVNKLNWKASCTSTSVRFEVERSQNGTNFSNIGGINATQAQCASPFYFTDNHPLPGVNYYRLKMIEIDGGVSYSKIVALYNNANRIEIVSLTPTLVNAGRAMLTISSAKDSKIELMVTDVQGRLVQKVSANLQSGSNNLKLDFSKLSSGTYNISGQTNEGKTRTIRFVKQ